MPGTQIPYVPTKEDALFTLYEGNTHNDPGPTEELNNPAAITAKHTLKPIQDEILNLIAKVNALETSSNQPTGVRAQAAGVHSALYLSTIIS